MSSPKKDQISKWKNAKNIPLENCCNVYGFLFVAVENGEGSVDIEGLYFLNNQGWCAYIFKLNGYMIECVLFLSVCYFLALEF